MIVKLQEKFIVEKIIALLMCCIIIELIFFKFSPDIAIQQVQMGVSTLTSFKSYQDYFLTENSVMYPRFFGNYILYELAQIITRFVQINNDIRLHPLRLSAGILTPIYFIIGSWPGVFLLKEINWKVFLTYYSIMFFCGLYVFYPYDAPSIAFISLSLSFIFRKELVYAFFCFIIAGLFRESSFHILIFVGVWAIVDKSYPYKTRFAWLALFFLAFVLQYKVIRYFYPGPITSVGNIILDINQLIFGKGFWSLTTFITLSLAFLFPITYFSCRCGSRLTWLHKFITFNCFLIPFWILFYRAMNGNISEFRMLWPVILPCIYGIAFCQNKILD